ncbi:hypothetical protein Pmani_031711 [Petrolisthes manimaculis]|uniref:Uncharacterized protein n=1 Tax=Petrolisthes manimaculis TaxID=1843537 RepID=A0AAE1NT42_9EUCA|nr:hypothetical protein Pmani_031711 [Petrolisthes manimaculis]
MEKHLAVWMVNCFQKHKPLCLMMIQEKALSLVEDLKADSDEETTFNAKIQKQNTHLREAIPPEQRLSVTLRYLATGESRRSLGFQYRISHNLISKIIPEVSSAIFTSLKPKGTVCANST